MFWELNLDSMEEQQVLLKDEPSIGPPQSSFLLFFGVSYFQYLNVFA